MILHCPHCGGGLAVEGIETPKVKPCGTHAAFNRHRSLGEEPCDACRDAERAYQRDRKRLDRQREKRAARDYVDEIAVERAIRGEAVRLTNAERIEAVRRLAERHESACSIAHRLRMSGSRTRELLERAGIAS